VEGGNANTTAGISATGRLQRLVDAVERRTTSCGWNTT
jgi:hypothetical protein